MIKNLIKETKTSYGPKPVETQNVDKHAKEGFVVLTLNQGVVHWTDERCFAM